MVIPSCGYWTDHPRVVAWAVKLWPTAPVLLLLRVTCCDFRPVSSQWRTPRHEETADDFRLLPSGPGEPSTGQIHMNMTCGWRKRLTDLGNFVEEFLPESD